MAGFLLTIFRSCNTWFTCILSIFDSNHYSLELILFKQRKNKKFNYKPRFQNSEQQDAKDDFETKWGEVRQGSKKRGRLFSSLPVMLLMLIAVIVLMYILNGYMI